MANLITILRIFIVYIIACLLFINTKHAYIFVIILTISTFVLDGVDGYIARKFNESSKLGAMLDIMGDRITENTFWIIFAVLGWLPAIFPIISLTRGFVTDGIRSVALEQGFTAFGETSMQNYKVSYIICSSRISRIIYASSKIIAFSSMVIAKTPGIIKDISVPLYNFAYKSSIFAILICVLRALPVVIEGKKFFSAKPPTLK